MLTCLVLLFLLGWTVSSVVRVARSHPEATSGLGRWLFGVKL